MSGPPHHPPHGRQAPPANATAWNPLQVPNYFPTRQPQHAHMSNEHSLLHQPTWHTPTTEPSSLKGLPHSHLFSLEQMLSERQFRQHQSPGVDLSLQRNGQNGDLVITTPISLSVRDAHKINSLPASALDIQPVDIPSKPISPAGLKRPNKRVDSIAERLNTTLDKQQDEPKEEDKPKSVIVQAASSHDENSNSSSILNVPTPTNLRNDEDSNEDSLDSNKSRRKRKPSKTIRVAKDEEKPQPPPIQLEEEEKKEEVTAAAVVENSPKTRRKTSSESETIDNIAAMVQQGLAQPQTEAKSSVSVSVIKSKDNLQDSLASETSDLSNSSNNVTTTEVAPTAPAPADNASQFVEVEDKLEEMFAGIEDAKNGETNTAPTNQDNVTSTSNEIVKKSGKKPKKGAGNKRRKRSTSFDKKKPLLKKQPKGKSAVVCKPKKSDAIVKDVYAYDSGSNASSSRSRGPFIQIRGPRDSPLSVSVINTMNDDDNERRPNKAKKFHDDSEYRHKVRSKGLHCSTLSHQYDAQTKDATWICAFCKRGPHATETTGPTLNGALPAPGDLFGPYFITTNSAEFERRLDDPFDHQFRSKKTARSLTAAGTGVVKAKRAKRNRSEDGIETSGDVFWGMTQTADGTFEVWAHEDCIVWSTGIYLVGPKIVGLEEAVWTSCNVVCVKCHLKGANICCLKRGCDRVAHVCCARLTNWHFDEDNYKTFCPEHRVL